MKTYVILTPSICNIGGAEQYISNKKNRLEKKAYKVIAFSYLHGKPCIQNLACFCEYVFPTLRLSPALYRQREQKNMIAKLVSNIQARVGTTDLNEVYIESTESTLALWAELLAKRLSAKHCCIDLQEKHQTSEALLKFLQFKYNREELYTIKPQAMVDILRSNSYCEDKHYIRAECTNVTADIECDLLAQIPSTDYLLGYIGRLDKPCVEPIVEQVIKYSEEKREKSFCFLIIGGGQKETENRIRQRFCMQKNLRIVISGYMYPIPLKLIKRFDCFISSAGSASVSAKNHIPTISVSTSGEPLGILNYTTRDSLFSSQTNETLTICDLLDLVLEERYCSSHENLGMYASSIDFQAEFEQQLLLFERTQIREYYDVNNINAASTKEKLYKLGIQFLGGRLFEKVQGKTHKLKRRIQQRKSSENKFYQA